MKKNNIDFQKALKSVVYGDGSYLAKVDPNAFFNYYKKNLKRSSLYSILLPGIGFVLFSLLILFVLFLKHVAGNLFVAFVSYAVFNFLLAIVLFVQYGCFKVRAVKIKSGSGFRFVNISKQKQDDVAAILKNFFDENKNLAG